MLSSSMAHLRIGILGQHGDAALHRDAWFAAAEANLVAGVHNGTDRNGHARDLETMVSAGPVSGVSLFTPTPSRRAMAMDCLSRGISVLTELPMAGDVESSLSLFAAARKSKAHLLAANKFRFAPALQLARGILGGGALGDVSSFDISLSQPANPGRDALMPMTASGLVFESGWAALDLIHNFFGPPDSIQAVRAARSSVLLMPEPVQLTVSFRGGMQGRIHLHANRSGDRSASVFSAAGTDGSIEIGWTGSYFRAGFGNPARIGDGVDARDAVRQMVMSFCCVLEGDAQPWSSIEESESVVRWIAAAQESLETGRPAEAPGVPWRAIAA